jgi:hypothetical protein
MPRNTLLLAILASSVIFLLGATPTPASAANCTFLGTSATWWTGSDNKMNFEAYIGSCTGDVDQVQFGAVWPGNQAGWFDASDRTCCPYIIATGALGAATQAGPGTSYRIRTYKRTPWCFAAHLIQPFYYWRIHNSTGGGSWGSWHVTWGSGQWAQC